MSNPGLEQLVGGSSAPHRDAFNAVAAAKVNGVVGAEVSLVIPSFSAAQVFATVPFIKKTAGAPVKGDSAVLHFDSDGHPVYAVVLT